MTSEAKVVDIPVEGSLGLLALGAVGIRAWRQKQKEMGYVNPNENIFVKKAVKENTEVEETNG